MRTYPLNNPGRRLAQTPEEALAGIRDLVAEIVNDMIPNNEQPPEPLALKRYSGKFTVRIPPEQHRRLALEAAEAGISLNRLASARLSS